ncbi:hypothetical protein HYPBUDRAFT_154093 [Hyphopichia burtonii NRRL Y-1933]|uniref:Ribosomal protein bL31m N-terminal domain-containing protein n=1 Tax=Hyphopichia burtonii NRRL Y-1933 TaxID=984485 RepID=A0A1E4RDF3_9ASCO|nr:hypothetical protein HYPBUDRAFT_154093 [Hyphopichia burtonii NRRL Y-1933]ODV65280.1 hypothetical protein HYPBUDRAFT_154093 [Hyphopichia burtonii NRRL Y-1933]
MFKSSIRRLESGALPFKTFQRNIAMKGDVHLSSRRVMKKIEMGKSRPTIFHQFETLVELSDGSVIKRRSQAPKDEIRMISDQRNNVLWNPNRSDIVNIDPNTTGRVNKFKQRFSAFETKEDKPDAKAEAASPTNKYENDDFIELMGHDVKEAPKGQLEQKNRGGKKK